MQFLCRRSGKARTIYGGALSINIRPAMAIKSPRSVPNVAKRGGYALTICHEESAVGGEKRAITQSVLWLERRRGPSIAGRLIRDYPPAITGLLLTCET